MVVTSAITLQHLAPMVWSAHCMSASPPIACMPVPLTKMHQCSRPACPMKDALLVTTRLLVQARAQGVEHPALREEGSEEPRPEMPGAHGILMHLSVSLKRDADQVRLTPCRTVTLGVEHPTPLRRRSARRHLLT